MEKMYILATQEIPEQGGCWKSLLSHERRFVIGDRVIADRASRKTMQDQKCLKFGGAEEGRFGERLI